MLKKNFFIDVDLALEKALDEQLCSPFCGSGEIPALSELKGILSNFLQGIFLFNEQDQLVYFNSKAALIAKAISQNTDYADVIPKEIACIKKFMLETRQQFPHQNWLSESTIFIDCLTVFQVCARWVQGDGVDHSYLLLKMEDQNQFSQDIALEEAKRLGLTSREQEVWLLHRANYTYKQIAEKLAITPNTVKKHMKSILIKQRAVKD
ncbi:MAG: helix-turn-helix transcriptional regulator [Leptolyngbyaceae cyanobacterium SM2_5_2]|nr:helix-turn-helix transcriptional regulator [Leptolyngbyaceae cyanobacterium SM2_5_2]